MFPCGNFSEIYNHVVPNLIYIFFDKKYISSPLFKIILYMIFLLFYAFGFIIQLSSFPWQSYGEVGSLRCFLRTPWRRSRLALFLHRAPLHRHPLTTAPSHDQWSGVSALSKWRQPERKWRIKESARESSGANQVVSRDPEIPSTTTTNEKVKKKNGGKGTR